MAAVLLWGRIQMDGFLSPTNACQTFVIGVVDLHMMIRSVQYGYKVKDLWQWRTSSLVFGFGLLSSTQPAGRTWR